MRVIYDYPEDAQNGDEFVVDDVAISPSTVTITVKRYQPKYDPKAERMADAVSIADRLVEQLGVQRGTGDPVVYLLVQAYEANRRSARMAQ